MHAHVLRIAAQLSMPHRGYSAQSARCVIAYTLQHRCCLSVHLVQNASHIAYALLTHLAAALRPPLNCGIASALAAITARESLGVTKNCLPRIMFLSPSPSAAAPNTGTLLLALLLPLSLLSLLLLGSTEPSAASPILATSSGAYVRLGSGWHPPKSSRGSHLISTEGDAPSSSTSTWHIVQWQL
jgi:hypothetical protein